MEVKEEFTAYRPIEFDADETLHRSREFYAYMNKRRSIRNFSDGPVEREVMENILKTAGTAPSGVNKQPWRFCLIGNPVLKRKIRDAAEAEEYENYHGRMNEEWLEDIRPFATEWKKPFIENAPWLIAVFKVMYGNDQGVKSQNYYVNESVGIACGMLLTAVHHAGLVAVTLTTSRMDYLNELLERPANERPYLLIPVGHPAEKAMVPAIQRKPLSETTKIFV